MKKIILMSSLSLLSASLFAQPFMANAVKADPCTSGCHYVDSLTGSAQEVSEKGGTITYSVINCTTSPTGNGDIPPNTLAVQIGFPLQYGIDSAIATSLTLPRWNIVLIEPGPSGQIIVTNQNLIPFVGVDSIEVPIIAFELSPTIPQSSVLNVGRAGPPYLIANTNPNNNFASIALKTIALPPVPTPLSLLDFTAKEKTCGEVELKWETAMEKNVDKFVIEYSKDGKSYAAVKEIKAENSASGARYSTTVKQNGTEGYYRLKSIDFDKTSAYSKVSKIVMNCMDRKITVAPNPATNSLTVATLEGTETVQIVNVIGQKVLEQKAKSGENLVDISQLPAGNYNLLIVENGQTTATFKVVKL